MKAMTASGARPPVSGPPSTRRSAVHEPSPTDAAHQQRILQGVSRTFALTIPQLPGPLALVVGNAYLLCRIADTVEDAPGLSTDERQARSMAFIRLVAHQADPEPFTRAQADLAHRVTPAEADLLAHVPQVLRITHGFRPEQRRILERCVRIMATGMSRHQRQASRRGLPDMQAMDDYCYHVAGVVGEMLTELFCDHSPAVAARREALMGLAVSFGQGLQMTNILKDVWEDHRRGACWLPRDSFRAAGLSLEGPAPDDAAYRRTLRQLIAIAGGHLHNALRYTLLIPPSEPGIRRFCLWATGMAVLTLRKIDRNPGYRSGQEAKISRFSVHATTLLTSLFVGSDRMLQLLFRLAARGLPGTRAAAGTEAGKP